MLRSVHPELWPTRGRRSSTEPLALSVGFGVEVSRQLEAFQDACRARAELVAIMSHELRTPLTAILGLGEVLATQTDGPLTRRQSEHVQDIVASARYLLSLVNNLQELSRLEFGRMELEYTRCSLPGLLDNALTFVRGAALRGQLQLVLRCETEVQLIWADERRLTQAVCNLLSNAVKFSPPDGEVVLEARTAEDRLLISVQDTGIGIALEDQTRIFQPFERVDRWAVRRREGTGLGLALTQRIVELHGGHIAVESALGAGSTFTVSLPLESPLL